MKLIKKEIKQNFTVDCEVEDTHCYQLENGIVSHNTLSLLGGSSPGGHPAYSKYFIRRVRFASNDKLVNICRDLGCPVEYATNFDGTIKHDTKVISFPCYAGENVIISKDMKAVDQLELVKKLQTMWADNAVSVTIYYKIDELPDIKKWMSENYETGIKSVSFLLHSEHGFVQAPLEEITKEKYDSMVQKMKPISGLHEKIDATGALIDGIECAGGACPLR